MKNKNFKLIYLCAVMTALCLLFTACTPQKPETIKEKPIQIALTQDILSFDPMLTSDIFSEAVLRCIYSSLYGLDENLQLTPKLAKTTTVVDDKTWKIEIHDNVKFHDGSPLTTDDVIFSIERAMKGGRTQKPLEMVKGVEKVDDHTFLLYSKEPYADLPFVFAKAETSIVSKKIVESEGYDFTKPVGSGPFKFAERTVGSKISLERFDDYFLEKAKAQFMDFVVIVTEQERTVAFLNNDVDILFSVSAYDCEKLRLSEGVELLQSPSSKIEYLSLNNLHPPLDNPKVRRAISYAIDRQSIANSVYHNYSVPAISLIPNGVTGYVEQPLDKDVEKAKELLKEAGQGDFEFTVIAIDTIRKNTLEHIKLDLAQIGITLNYKLVTMKEAVDMMTAGEHDGILVGWAFNSDPNSVLPLILGTGSGKTMNSSNYSNPVVDDLLAKGRAEMDYDKRLAIYEEINRIVVEDSPIVVLQNPMVISATHSDIEGITINPQGLTGYENFYRVK